MSLYLFVKFVHLIAAMVFFGLPIAFGRWFRTGSAAGDRRTPALALRQIEFYVFLHLNLCGSILLASGWWMAETMGFSMNRGWLLLSLAGIAATLANLNLLGFRLHRQVRHPQFADPDRQRAVRRHLIRFSAIHHTLVTAITALMVFRPHWP